MFHSEMREVKALENHLKLNFKQLKGVCVFIGKGHLTYDPWIWLKVTSMASTASNRKNAKNQLNSTFFMIQPTLRDQDRSFC